MKSVLKLTTAAAALAGTALFCAPASAAYIGVGVSPIGFDIYSGGYCDRWGCPTDYWSYPIYYGPIYYNNAWYRGPVYYRNVNGERWYWVHGAWRRDEWRGPRPTWARYYHYGPALGLDYYRAHGFRVRDGDWRAWQDRDYGYRAGYRTYDQGGTYGNEDRYPRYRDYDVDRDQVGGYDRDRTYDRDMNRDNGYDRDYDRDRGPYEHSGSYDRDQYYGRGDENGPDYDRDRGYTGYDRDRGYDNSGYDRDRSDQRSDYDRDRNGYDQSDYDRDRGTYQHSNYEGSGGASGTGYISHTTHHTHTTYGSYRHNTMSSPSGRDHGYTHSQYNRDKDQGYAHTQYQPDEDRMDRDRTDQDRTRGDRNPTDDQTRDHGNPGPTGQDRSENQNGYQHTTYERPGSYGHAKGLPPSSTHNGTHSHPATNPDNSHRTSNPDDGSNGPSD